jgi:hypothetical protein
MSAICTDQVTNQRKTTTAETMPLFVLGQLADRLFIIITRI